MRQAERLLFAIVLLASLAGCATTPGSGSRSDARASQASSNRDAAALQIKLGQGYMDQGELEIARDRLRRALELDPKSVDAHTLMAVLNERIGRPTVAEQFYQRAVELKPEDGSVNNNYGTFLCGSGRHAESQAYFERAIADPFYRTPAVAYANSGFCALRSGDNVRAEKMLRAALELDPEQPGTLFELARLQFAAGDMMRARAFLQRYEALSDADPTALELGARIEQQIGNHAAADRYRDSLQQQFPDFIPATAIDGPGSP